MGFSKIKILGIFSENPERPPNSEKKILGNFRGGLGFKDIFIQYETTIKRTTK